jgi:hypothetical protein
VCCGYRETDHPDRRRAEPGDGPSGERVPLRDTYPDEAVAGRRPATHEKEANDTHPECASRSIHHTTRVSRLCRSPEDDVSLSTRSREHLDGVLDGEVTAVDGLEYVP